MVIVQALGSISGIVVLKQTRKKRVVQTNLIEQPQGLLSASYFGQLNVAMRTRQQRLDTVTEIERV